MFSSQTRILLFGVITLLLVGGGILVSYLYFPKNVESGNIVDLVTKNSTSSSIVTVSSVTNIVNQNYANDTLMKPQSKKYAFTMSAPIFYFTQKIADGGLEVVDISKNTEKSKISPSKNDFVLIENAKAIIIDSSLPNQWIGDYYVDPAKKLDLSSGNSDIVNYYFWLNSESLKANLIKIKELLIQKDIDNKIVYEKNYDRLTLQLDGMTQKYKKKLTNCSTKTLIENGNTFEDVALQFGLEHVSINNLELIKLTEEQSLEVKATLFKNKVKTIFVVGNYTDAELNVISTLLENIEIIKLENYLENKFGIDYFDFLEKNLVALNDGLGCI
jgi:ABC-type Zn uptake system ZnuABC Zn-binding protein ZnuA